MADEGRSIWKALGSLFWPAIVAGVFGVGGSIILIMGSDAGAADEQAAGNWFWGYVISIGVFAISGIPLMLAWLAPRRRRPKWQAVGKGILLVSAAAAVVCVVLYMRAVIG